MDSLGILNASTANSLRKTATNTATPMDSKYSLAALLRANGMCRLDLSSSFCARLEILSWSSESRAFSRDPMVVFNSVRPRSETL